MSKLKNWGSWEFQIKIGTASQITRESTKKRGQDDGQWLVNDWPTPTPHTLGGWQSQRPTLTQPVTTPTTLYIKKPVRIFLVMLKIFFRNTLWRKYNSWRYSLHLILWLQKVSLKTKYTPENMNKVRTLSIDYEWMIKEKHEFQMFFATIMLLFHFSSRIEFFGLSVIVIKKTNYHPFNENHSQYMFFFEIAKIPLAINVQNVVPNALVDWLENSQGKRRDQNRSADDEG